MLFCIIYYLFFTFYTTNHYPPIYVRISPVVCFLQVSPPKPCIRLSSTLYALHAPPISFFSILSPEKVLGEQYRSLSSSLCSFLHSPVISSPLALHIILFTLFSYTLSLRPSLHVNDHISHPYKTTGLKQ